MGGDSADAPLVIVGPTASGKSSLALEFARRARDGACASSSTELVSVDSMAVYRGMDVGTAKPTAAERSEVRHHLIDFVDPAERFTVVDYAEAFASAMADIAERRAIPLLVGGTGLYLRAVVDGLTPPPEFPDIAAELDSEARAHPEGIAALHRRLAQLDPLAASRMEPTNARRVVRALSVCLGAGRAFSSYGPGLRTYPDVPFRMLGIDVDLQTLDQRIADRCRRQLENGFLDEVRQLTARPLSRTAAQALGYKELRAHLDGSCTLEEATDVIVRRTRRFARRQRRWFARDPRITWIAHGHPAAMADRVQQLCCSKPATSGST
ncbi:tRNA (adenosine(37)-N6)-dimethylallyltransferase MiaA [Candidatus Poriferisodalis sp.]|uniref:tRNA (adenosine(37)-N6)-dimethylallyltransferase MiaA n=1 Tax=Candidatus Poriferisodalis sp. TaxID=3101277 RepID=UPI003B015FCC